MIQSMTGYGKAVVVYKEKKINVEIKSLNSKQLDLTTRVAPLYREKEMEIRQMVAQRVIRGKVEMGVWIEKDAVSEATPLNVALMENYYQPSVRRKVLHWRRSSVRRLTTSNNSWRPSNLMRRVVSRKSAPVLLTG